MSDPNELLDNLRHVSSRLKGAVPLQWSDEEIADVYGAEYLDVIRMCDWFIQLDIAIMEGKAPDSWAGVKLSKSFQEGK